MARHPSSGSSTMNGSRQRIQIQDPTTWLKYKNGMCVGCWSGCCTLPVEANLFDLIRLELISEEEAAMTPPAQIAKALQKRGIVRQYQNKSQLFILEQRAGRDCLFLHPETRLCTVYEKRPTVCRSFPKIGPKPGFCPGFSATQK